MDNLQSVSAEKRISKNLNKAEVIHCVRKFTLPQQFPSKIKLTKYDDVNCKIRSKTNVTVPFTKTLTISENEKISNTEYQVPYKKLRILSHDGRDLGEFNVKSQINNPSKYKTLANTKSDTLETTKKSLAVCLTRVSNMSNKISPCIVNEGIANIAKSNLINVASCHKNIISKVNKTDVLQQQSTSLPINAVFTNDEDIHSKDKQICNNYINTDKALSTKETNSRYLMHLNVDNNKQDHIVFNGINNVNTCKKSQGVVATIGNDEIISMNTKMLYKEIIESPFPIINCKKLVINSNDSNCMPLTVKNFKESKGKCIATIKKTENGKIVTSLKSAVNLTKGYNQINRNLNSNNLNSNKESLDNRKVLDNRNKSFIHNQVNETKTQENITIIPNNKILPFNQNVAIQECNTVVSSTISKNITRHINHCKVTCDTKSDSTQNKHIWYKESKNDSYPTVMTNNCMQCTFPKSQESSNIGANIQCNIQNKNLSEIDSADRLNIIRKAMDSVKDDELRERALKALAECGIGIERYVPIRPAEEHKAVHDTQVQTMVFGLIDPNSLILINKNLDSIHRLNQITLNNVPDDQNSLENNLFSCNVMPKSPIISEEDSDFDIDNFLKKISEENSSVRKMKETLSPMKIRCKDLIEQLKKDFESAKKYDQNGMLNIHKAVISDNINLVQRHLMVLKQCKQNIDVLTEDGMTSLELAIKHDVRSEIVQLLLEAGAQPVTPKYIHESALITACKLSSSSLPMLVNYISDSKLLNQVDSEGLTALHYCSIHGNLQGVNILLSGGATIDMKDMKSGRTPLFHAIDNCHTLVAQALLKAGAIANIPNYAGQTPVPIVTDAKSGPLKILLKRTGAT